MTEKFDSEIRELELKYKADEISLLDFKQLCESLSPVSHLEVAGWDTYYSGLGQKFEFLRHRQGDKQELTVKIKTNEKNNNDRVEVDLPLIKNADPKIVAKFAESLGFLENFRIYKYCYIYFYEKVDLVYYITYNKSMKEVGRYIEIESRKDVEKENEQEAWKTVKEFEQTLGALGLTAANRMKRSLWEIYKKN